MSHAPVGSRKVPRLQTASARSFFSVLLARRTLDKYFSSSLNLLAQETNAMPKAEKTYYQDWETAAALDPFWAVLTSSATKNNAWDQAEFFSTGAKEIEGFMAAGDLPQAYGDALDFGCGVGRLTQALAAYSERVVGLDRSATMIEQANRLNTRANVRFVHNPADNLSLFPDSSFDLIYSNISLQHVFSQAAIRSYLHEFIRVSRPNGLICFQLPATDFYQDRKTAILALKIREVAYHCLKSAKFSQSWLYRHNIRPYFRMSHVPGQVVENLFLGNGCSTIRIDRPQTADAFYYFKKLPAQR